MVGEIVGDCGWFVVDCGWFLRNKGAGEKMEAEKTEREKRIGKKVFWE